MQTLYLVEHINQTLQLKVKPKLQKAKAIAEKLKRQTFSRGWANKMIPVEIKHKSVNIVVTNILYLALIITDMSSGARRTI